jgi:hypothetical protein
MSLELSGRIENGNLAEAEDRINYLGNLQIAGGILAAILALIALWVALIAPPNPGAERSISSAFFTLGGLFAAVSALSFLLAWKIKQYRPWAVVIGGLLSLLIFFVFGVGLFFTILAPILYVWFVIRPVFKAFGAIGELNRRGVEAPL